MNKALGFLGLMMRAGYVKSGAENCLKLIRGGQVHLLLLDEDISEGSLRPLADACREKGVAYAMIAAGGLGQAIGKSGRMAAVVTDEKAASRLRAMPEIKTQD